jgi:hypothetical protein
MSSQPAPTTGASPGRALDARARYTANLAERKRSVDEMERRDRSFSMVRLTLFGIFLFLLWLVFVRHAAPLWVPVLPVVAFTILAIAHELLAQRRKRMDRAVSYYQHGLARLEGEWAGQGSTGERFLDPAHPYAIDLDLFGTESIFQRLCLARTRAGEARLALWLLEPSPPREVTARQGAVEELRDEVELRESLYLAGAELEVGIHPEELQAWSKAAPILTSGAERAVAFVLGALAVIAVIAWIGFGTGLGPLAAVVILQGIFRFRMRHRVQQVEASADDAATDLKLLSEVLRVFERRTFSTERLRELHDRLTGGPGQADRPASEWIRILHRHVDCLEARRNAMFAPIAFLTLWDVHFAFAIDRWRSRTGEQVSEWLAAVAELEALSSLAGYALERPEDKFPELVEHGTLFSGEEMRHPLVRNAVPNSVTLRSDTLDTTPAILVISGSNMSGKSTLLRTVGVLLALAQAGAPVSARKLVVSPLALGASIRVRDSIQGGISHFYAEILRLRQIVALTSGARPVLFIVDEILQGTNSHDRRMGVEAVLHSLLDRGAIGLITTHDLALAEIAESLAPRARNVHFEDHLENGRMAFDYRLREGVVTHSNAIALMRAVGLDV